ncbi:hypothetical protein [Frankia nepalensis]|nr:hypothetical protein [Frankia nepalensis]
MEIRAGSLGLVRGSVARWFVQLGDDLRPAMTQPSRAALGAGEHS